MAKRRPWKVGETRKTRRWTCKKLNAAGRKECRVGEGELFTIDPHKSRKLRTDLKPYRFTKADARGCKQSDRKARGKCIAKHAQARTGG